MLDTFNNIVSSANDYLWGYILIAALLFVGLYFTVATRFVQFRKIGEMVRLLGEGVRNTGKGKKGVSSFQAFCVATASRVGTGNLAGVATALALGGPGAVFWMWLIALIGSASAFAESTLAQLYKTKGDKSFIGGPAFYIQRALNMRWLGVVFAVIISITFGMVFNSVQANTIAIAFQEVFSFPPHWMGVLLTSVTLIVVFGGIRRIAVISGIIVPVMAVIYLLLALTIIVMRADALPSVLEAIFTNAFGGRQFVSGAIGATLMQGVKRGLFSNEAGMGSAPNAAATANVSHPVKQGLIQALSVFTDTLLICSCTAFIILLSGAPLDGSQLGIQLTQNALVAEVGAVGGVFIAVAILMFAFSSIVGNYSYCETNIQFISKRRIWLYMYRLLVGAMVFFGSVVSLDVVWNLADFTMALMALINLYAIFRLRHTVAAALKNFLSRRKKGSFFRAEEIGIRNTDFWK